MALSNSLSDMNKKLLLSFAHDAIQHGLSTGQVLPLTLSEFPDILQENGASFVTLKRQGRLRGCIGSLVAHQPLIQDVIQHAFDAAFKDHRFPPLSAEEFEGLEIHISVLTPPIPIRFHSESDLLARLRPGIDGVILKDQGYQGTFLPAVWRELPLPIDFLCHLKQKAGLPKDYWSDTISFYRYEVEEF